MTIIEYKKWALDKFKTAYLGIVTSADLQTFLLGFQSCLDICLKPDNKKWVIKDLTRLKFISIDKTDGYPNYLEIHQAKYFDSFEDAETYRKTSPKENWEIKEIYFKTISI